MDTKLKVKVKVLAYEAQVIRREEVTARNKGRTVLRSDLYHHRIGVVRREARATHLARAFLWDKDYKTVEGNRVHGFENGVLDSTLSMIRRYGGDEKGNTTMDTLKEWIVA